MTDLNTLFTDCDLHIPYKDWSDDPKEFQNYTEMERWAHNFRTNCLPTPGGGGVTVHRAKFNTSSFIHQGEGSTSSTVFRGNNLNQYPDWTVGSTEDEIDAGVFTATKDTIDTPIPLIIINRPGFLAWTGRVFWQITDTTAVGDLYYDIFDDHNQTDFEQQQFSKNALVDGLGGFGIGGSAYVPADTWWELVMRQSSGVDGTGFAGITMTLLEF